MEPKRFPRAGGALLAFAILAGVAAGVIEGEPSIGFIAGLGIGLLLLAVVWVWERR